MPAGRQKSTPQARGAADAASASPVHAPPPQSLLPNTRAATDRSRDEIPLLLPVPRVLLHKADVCSGHRAALGPFFDRPVLCFKSRDVFPQGAPDALCVAGTYN